MSVELEMDLDFDSDLTDMDELADIDLSSFGENLWIYLISR